MVQTLLIDGWWGSGKSTLRGLLDGHPDLCVFPVQESFVGGLASDPYLDDWIKHRDLSGFRRNLHAYGQYARIEKEAREGRGLCQPAGDAVLWNEFQFDFYAFDRALMDAVESLEAWTVDGLIGMFYRTMGRHAFPKEAWDRGDWPEYAVSLENNQGRLGPFVCERTTQVKTIWIDRETEGILASYKSRKPVQGMYESERWEGFSLKGFAETGRITAIDRARRRMCALEQAYPERIKVLSFEKLVFDTANEMDKAVDFLGISPDEVLTRVTKDGRPFPGSDRYLGQVNDDPATAFTEQERAFIRSEGQQDVPAKVRRVQRALKRRARRILPFASD